jgi:ribonuclease VapC
LQIDVLLLHAAISLLVIKQVYVFDTSAILAILAGEVGADYAQDRLEGAIMSNVNLVEVVTRLVDWGYLAEEIETLLAWLDVRLDDLNQSQAMKAGFLRVQTRAKGLSLGDRACLALAHSTGRTALTADRAWTDLDIGVPIELIR